ncbi:MULTISPECIES: hypothetical protein [Streptomyces]|uniref:Lipoprotein n=2 Tax=Streptomyces TaxID=1883 RepID=A0ABU4K9J6_9ACTN|nr:hypothetical protein [Streptomyces roseolus]MDX2294423.1 hypothetical protein [Streptomyces roseolus]
MKLRHLSVACAVLAAAVSITACDTSDSSGSGSGTPSEQVKADSSQGPAATPEKGLAAGLSLPLEDYMQSYSQTVVISQAIRNLQTECMARYGFDYKPPRAGNTPPPNDNDANIERRYGITDRDLALKAGYGLGETAEQTRSQAPAMSKAAMLVLSGQTGGGPGAKPATSYEGKSIPKGGCSGWAIEKIGAHDLDFTLAGRLNHESLVRSQESREVRAALEDWSKCMKGKGYSIDIPYNAADLAPEPGSVKQVQVATADIDCKESTNLVKIWFEQDSAIQRKQIAENELTLLDARKKNEAAVKAAEQALRD